METYELTKKDFIPIKGYFDYSNRCYKDPNFKLGEKEDIECLIGQMKLMGYNTTVSFITCGLIYLLSK